MRFAICSISLVLTTIALVGCGQSGNLQLANSPDSDKRAHYLLYSKDGDKANQTEQKVKDLVAPADQTRPASQ